MFTKVYHISRINNRKSILKHGLLALGHSDEHCNWKEFVYSRRICISLKNNDVHAKDFVDYEGIDIYRFTVLKKHLHRDYTSHSKYHYYIKKDIPTHSFKLLKTIPFKFRKK